MKEMYRGGSKRRSQARDGLETTIKTTMVTRRRRQHEIFQFSSKWL